jgi:crotonobetainyl-CoA:carnitine CoA-transferase CaiB-like acyl-CoA transferase
MPAWFSRTPGRIAGLAPRLGAHTQQIMDELGMAAADKDISSDDSQPDLK